MKRFTVILLALFAISSGCLNDIEEAQLELFGIEVAAPQGLTARVSSRPTVAGPRSCCIGRHHPLPTDLSERDGPHRL